jgi:hypothetical protein
MHGCQTGNKSPIFHAKYDQAHPAAFSNASFYLDQQRCARARRSDAGVAEQRDPRMHVVQRLAEAGSGREGVAAQEARPLGMSQPAPHLTDGRTHGRTDFSLPMERERRLAAEKHGTDRPKVRQEMVEQDMASTCPSQPNYSFFKLQQRLQVVGVLANAAQANGMARWQGLCTHLYMHLVHPAPRSPLNATAQSPSQQISVFSSLVYLNARWRTQTAKLIHPHPPVEPGPSNVHKHKVGKGDQRVRMHLQVVARPGAVSENELDAVLEELRRRIVAVGDSQRDEGGDDVLEKMVRVSAGHCRLYMFYYLHST